MPGTIVPVTGTVWVHVPGPVLLGYSPVQSWVQSLRLVVPSLRLAILSLRWEGRWANPTPRVANPTFRVANPTLSGQSERSDWPFRASDPLSRLHLRCTHVVPVFVPITGTCTGAPHHGYSVPVPGNYGQSGARDRLGTDRGLSRGSPGCRAGHDQRLHARRPRWLAPSSPLAAGPCAGRYRAWGLHVRAGLRWPSVDPWASRS